RNGSRNGRGDGNAVYPAARRERGVGDRDNGSGAVLFELAHDHRAEVVEGRLRPVDRRHTVTRLPIAQTDKIETGAFEDAGVIAERVLLHSLQNVQLDLGDFVEAD